MNQNVQHLSLIYTIWKSDLRSIPSYFRAATVLYWLGLDMEYKYFDAKHFIIAFPK